MPGPCGTGALPVDTKPPPRVRKPQPVGPNLALSLFLYNLGPKNEYLLFGLPQKQLADPWSG